MTSLPLASGKVRLPLGILRPLRLAAAIFVLVAALPGGLCEAQNAPANAPKTTIPLAPSESKEFQLDPNQSERFVLDMEARTGIQISFQQTREMLSVIWASDSATSHVPRTNDAGLRSAIRFSIVSGEHEEQAFDVSCLHVHLPCDGIVTVSAARPASSADVTFAAQEESLAEAEDIRRHGDHSTWPAALEKFRSSADFFQAAGDGILRRAALNGESRLLLYKLSDYHAAHDAALASAAVDTGDADRQGQGLTWKTLSSVEYFLGDYTAGIQAAQKAIALYKLSGDDYWQGILLGNLAYTYRETGDTAEALDCSEQALTIARRIQDEFGVSFNLEALATVHLSRGELEQAFELYYEALDATHVQPYPAVEAAIWSGLGDLYSQLNDEKRAEECFQKALPLTESASDAAGMLKVISSLGELYLRQDRPNDALGILQKGLQQAQKLGLVREQSLLSAGVARSEAELGNSSAAQANFETAVDTAARIANKDAEATALLHFGDFEYRAGHPVRARDLYARAFELWTQESNRAQAATALASLARLDSDAGDLPKARKEIEDALGFFETSRSTLASRELRTSFFSSKHAYYDLAISILMRLHANDPAKGYDAEAFTIAERASSRVLLDEIAAGNIPTFVRAPADLLRERQSDQNHLDALFERLRSLSDDPQKNAVQMSKVRAEIEDQLRASDTLEGRIRAASGDYTAFTGARVTTPEEIAEQVGPHSALAKYWVGTDKSYLWLTAPHGFRSFTIPANGETIRSLTGHWLDSLQARSFQKPGESLADRGQRLAVADAAERSTAENLGKLLLPGLDGLTGIERIYIVPDGPLSSIPFAALRIPTGKPAGEPRSSEFLLSRFEVLTEPSEAVLQLLSRPHSQPNAAPHIAVFADAVYSASDPRVEGRLAPRVEPINGAKTLGLVNEAGMAHLARLTASAEEARAIGILNGESNTSIHMGFQALASAIREDDWSHYEVVHFGVHALLNPERPAFSGVVLTMVHPDGAPRNGVLWLSDIYALRMPVNLVVLSGCRTANGREIPGEGLEGLSRAFFFAGARSVVGSLWSVEDRETSLLMQRFYRNLVREKLSPAAALRRAQLATAGEATTSAPFHWAGFAIQGDGVAPLTSSFVP
jgi:CHAT domain-containing protein/tetratricopeptide (TPR) repeat protein